MKFADVNGIKMEAEKGLVGRCVGCAQPMIPVCGAKKEKHWRHKVDCECDRWWESETEWHRSWKNNFPKERQEIRHQDAVTGEWHISDVKTSSNYYLEFQHSFLKPDERQARNKFYGEKLVWVVDGLARKNDWPKMERALKSSVEILQGSSLFRLPSSVDEVPLFEDWCDCKVPVFFDFGHERPLWCLLPKSSKGCFYILPFHRQNFVTLQSGGRLAEKTFDDVILFLKMRVFAIENPQVIAEMQKAKMQNQAQVQVPPRPMMQRYVPAFCMGDLNYLLRPRQHFRRRGRRL